MYTKFYGLKENPFGISPNPSYYFPTPRHDEALANLWYGIQQRKGCVVLTGEVGTGKTLLVRRVMNALDRTDTRYAYVFNTRTSPEDFLYLALTDLGLKPTGQTHGQMLVQLHQFLLEAHRQGSTVAVIIDEAHLLSREMLEEVRLLTNLETTQHKLLQVLLVGQPELDSQLEQPELRQLKQRVSLRCRLEPLTPDEVVAYIHNRLKRARVAPENKTIFSHAALEQITKYCHGIPRVINTICENALITGYARQCPLVGVDIVEQVVTDFHLEGESQTEPTPNRLAMSKAHSAKYEVVPAPGISNQGTRNTGGGSGLQ